MSYLRPVLKGFEIDDRSLLVIEINVLSENKQKNRNQQLQLLLQHIRRLQVVISESNCGIKADNQKEKIIKCLFLSCVYSLL